MRFRWSVKKVAGGCGFTSPTSATLCQSAGAVDDEAKKRATSVYLPDRVIPMIPEIISNHLASLQPERIRLVKTVEIEMLDDLTITHTEVHNAAIHSDMRLNYEQVDQFLCQSR